MQVFDPFASGLSKVDLVGQLRDILARFFRLSFA